MRKEAKKPNTFGKFRYKNLNLQVITLLFKDYTPHVLGSWFCAKSEHADGP